jgi:hypothetical protein
MPGRVTLVVAGIVVLVLAVVILFNSLGGSSVPTTSRVSSPTQASESGVESARQDLARQNDLNACRSALQQINAEIGEKPSLRPPALTDEQKSWLSDNLNLSSDELSEVDSSHFTRLDQIYLSGCFLMRDTAHDALEVKGVRGKAGGPAVHEKPLDQAARAFAWVMREVRLRPSEAEADPPSYVVRRGMGTALERALIFLALLEQLGDLSATEPELLGFLLQVPDNSGGMRLWACGVVAGDGKEVYLFDPSLGLPVPGPNGDGIATLAQARRQPEILAQLNAGEKNRYPVTMEQARSAQAQLVCPLSALSPRMRYLQDKLLAPAVRVRLACDAAKEVERIKAACSAGAEKPTSVIVPRDQCTLLRRFMSVDEGGADTTYREVRFIRDLVPWNALPAVFQNEQLFPQKSALRIQVQTLFVNHFIRSLNTGSPRDLLLRGRYRSAVEKLVSERVDLRRALEQRANVSDLEAQFQKWLELATKAYARQVTAKSPQEREQAERQVKAVWQGPSSLPIYVVINGAAAGVRNSEVAYQLGLCSQEEAEQLQARLDLQARTGAAPYQPDVEKARSAWQNALQNWRSFDEDAPRQHPDRPAARFLRARAESMLDDPKAAIASWKAVADWKNEPGAPTDLERIAASFLAQQGEKKLAGKAK